jgi:hypothetical protein
MRLRGIVACMAVLLTATPALAGWLDSVNGVSGTWSTQDGCNWAAASKRGWPSTLPAGFDQFSYLRSSGVDGYEWGCKFLMQDRDGRNRILAVAICDAEGDSWPETFLIERAFNGTKENGWRLITKGERGGTDVTEFPVRCDQGSASPLPAR